MTANSAMDAIQNGLNTSTDPKIIIAHTLRLMAHAWSLCYENMRCSRNW